MKFKLGFESEQNKNEYGFAQHSEAKKSLVEVMFPDKNLVLTYFNDMFDLHEGDFVYVEGRLEGIRGIVVSVSYNFKIRISDYRKVVCLVDTDIKGSFYQTLTHFITFEPDSLPAQKVLSWYRLVNEDDYEFSTDDSSFPLDELEKMDISEVIRNRGINYHKENRVRYISLYNGKGFAIVEGSEAYTVEFEYNDGQIKNLLCDCYCSYNCKHMYAAMLTLRDMLESIEKSYKSQYEASGCFAAVCKDDLYTLCIRNRKDSTIEL